MPRLLSPLRPHISRPLCAIVLVFGFTACAHLETPPSDEATFDPSVTRANDNVAIDAPAGRKIAGVTVPPKAVDPSIASAPFIVETPQHSEEVQITDLWERMRMGFRLDALQSPLVTRHEQWYASRPDYVQRMTERAGRYLYFILEEVEQRGMPSEAALLPFIESAFNPQAMSIAKASGMWQFIPGTGKHFGLRQTWFQDERRDVVESTRAALDYLQKLHDMFGDWQLAFAAYNCGEGNVQRAIDKNRRKRKPTDYAALSLPNETRNYVPKLQAVKNIVMNPARFGLTLPHFENEQYFVAITKTRDIDVERAAAFAGMSVDEFAELNPSFDRPMIIGATQPQLLLPRDKVAQFLANMDFADGPLASYTVYKVTERQKLEQVALKFGIGVDELRELNKLPRHIVLRPGGTLLVPRHDDVQQDIPSDALESAALLYDADVTLRKITVTARRGDNFASLAKRYGVTADQMRQWNDGMHDRLNAGQKLVMYKPVVSTKGRVLRASAAKRSAPSKATRSGHPDASKRSLPLSTTKKTSKAARS